MASGENELEFILACDDDDPGGSAGFFREYIAASEDYVEEPEKEIRVSIQERPIGVAACWNSRLSETDADAILILPDDGLICTPHWDTIINIATADEVMCDLDIACLDDMANPGQATLFVVGPKWLALTGPKLLDERFPAWFADTAIAETYSFITGHGLPVLNIKVATKPGGWNPRLREMKLWWRLYARTRLERMATAERIRKKLGFAEPGNLKELVEMWEQRDIAGLPASYEIVRMNSNPKPPDEHYLLAREAALSYLETHPNGSAHLDSLPEA